MNEALIQILLVEDDDAHAELIRRAFLAHAGPLTLHITSDLHQAHAYLTEHSPHLIIADYRLPDGNGMELLPTDGPQNACPVIIMTSHGDEQVAVEAMKSGALDYVVKSDATLAELPRITERAFREWGYIRERRHAEEALRESEERFRRIFADSPLGMGVLDKQLRWINVNATLCRMLGYTDDALQGTPISAFVHPDDTLLNDYLAKQLFQGETPSLTLELRFQRKDGETIWARMTASVITDAARNVLYGLGMVEDITERKQTEEALQESERFAQAIADTTPSLVYIYDVMADENVWVNATYREVLGDIALHPDFDPHVRSRIHPDSRPILSTRLAQLADQTDAIWLDAEYKIRAYDGTWHWLFDRAAVFSRSDAGHITQVIGSAIDITERKQAEEALRTSEANLSEAQRIAHMGSWEWHLADDVMTWSDELYRIFRLTPQMRKIPFDQFISYVHPDDQTNVREKIRTEVFEHQVYTSHEYRILRSDGVERIVRSEGVLQGDAQDSTLRLIGTLQDITERRQLERELLEISHREQQRIGQDLHDELGQLLTGIYFRITELEDTLQQKQLPDARDAGEIGMLIQDAISQTRALAQGLNPVGMEAGGLRMALTTLTRSIEQIYEIPCTLTCPEPLLLDDNETAIHVYRIAQEALNNAIKHGQATELAVTLVQNEGTARLTIQDNGIGIPEPRQRGEGMGLRNMRYRTSMIHGLFNVQRRAQGGTVVTCEFAIH